MRKFSSDDFTPSFQTSPIKKGKVASLYVYRSVVNTGDIVAWAKEQGFTSIVDPKELHVTVIYSRAPIDWFSLGESYSGNGKGEITINPGGPRAVEALGDKGAIVLMFASSDLTWRNSAACEYHGASWDYESYQPHITLTYNGGDLNLEEIEPYSGKIVLGPEMFEDLDEEFVPSEEGAGLPYTKADFTISVPIAKTQDDQNLVFGWAYVCEQDGQQVVDHSGEVIDESDLEKAFYEFAENIGVAGDMHDEIGVGKMVECMVFTKEKQKALGIDLKKVGVWVGFRLNDETYAKVKGGNLKMFSIGGNATRVKIDA